MATKPLKELFGVNSQQSMDVGDQPPKYRASPIDSYVFRPSALSDVLLYWRLRRRACMITGHKGCGKTSLVEQFHLRVNQDLVQMTGNGKTNLEALFGQYVLNSAGNLEWQDGPVTMAARQGFSVLINEFNAIPEDVQIALNDVAHEGAPFAIPEKGEQFMPAPGFRIFGTINPKGANDFMYRGRKEMDAALKERWFWINLDYGTEEEEKKIVLAIWKKHGVDEVIAKPLVEQMLAVARDVRDSAERTDASAIPEIISTRVLVNWAEYWSCLRSKEGAVHLALQRALTFGCRPEVAFAIHAIVATRTSVPSPYGLVRA